MKRFILTLASLVVVVVLLGAAMAWYVRPTQALDLNYQEVDLQKKIESMVLETSLTIPLTDEELNNLFKQELNRNTEPVPHIRITGAHFSREGNELIADLNVLFREKVPAQIQLVYQLEWHSPDLKLLFVDARIKGKGIPGNWFNPGDILIPIEDKLPPFIIIKSVDFTGLDILFKLGIQR